MHISKASVVNYRNFRGASLILKPGVNTVIGENGSGKSNLFRAIRLLLDESLVTRQYDLQEDDFHRGLDDWRGHWIVICLEFSDVSNDESMQSLLLQHAAEEAHGATDTATYALVFRPKREVLNKFAALPDGDHAALDALRQTITIDSYERVLLGKMKVDLSDPNEYERIVGNFETVNFASGESGNAPMLDDDLGIRVPREMSLWREFSFTFIPALRNVVADFNDSRRNPLRTLLAAKSEQIPEGDFDEIIAKVDQLNSDIEERGDVQEIKQGIHRTFKDTVGETFSPTSMRIQSELPLEAADLFKSLKLYVGEHGEASPRRLHEMSLGGANLIYLTLKLLEFEYRSAQRAIANFLLIEEPEAHIHTHVQKTLFDHVTFENTQIIYSTHSTHISEVSEIERVNVLSREEDAWVVLQPAAGLGDPEVHAAQRFLDAIRSNLLFARSVLMVEGDAEEILVPGLMKKIYGISLDEIGVSLVNVRSTGFETLARLFDDIRLRKRCAIITDYDQVFFDVTEDAADSDGVADLKKKAIASAHSGVKRKTQMDAFVASGSYLSVSYAPHTFEVDLAAAAGANRTLLSAVVDEVYSSTSHRVRVKNALDSEELADHGRAALAMAKRAKKGWFALLLGRHLDAADNQGGPVLPEYIVGALGYAAAELPRETWARILECRVGAWRITSSPDHTSIEDASLIIQKMLDGSVSVADGLAEFSELSHQDQRIRQLATAFGVWPQS